MATSSGESAIEMRRLNLVSVRGCVRVCTDKKKINSNDEGEPETAFIYMYVDKSRPWQRPDVAILQEMQYSIFNIIVYQRGCRMGWCIWTAWGDYPVSILRILLLLLLSYSITP